MAVRTATPRRRPLRRPRAGARAFATVRRSLRSGWRSSPGRSSAISRAWASAKADGSRYGSCSSVSGRSRPPGPRPSSCSPRDPGPRPAALREGKRSCSPGRSGRGSARFSRVSTRGARLRPRRGKVRSKRPPPRPSPRQPRSGRRVLGRCPSRRRSRTFGRRSACREKEARPPAGRPCLPPGARAVPAPAPDPGRPASPARVADDRSRRGPIPMSARSVVVRCARRARSRASAPEPKADVPTAAVPDDALTRRRASDGDRRAPRRIEGPWGPGRGSRQGSRATDRGCPGRRPDSAGTSS